MVSDIASEFPATFAQHSRPSFPSIGMRMETCQSGGRARLVVLQDTQPSSAEERKLLNGEYYLAKNGPSNRLWLFDIEL
jgi:hypothetical protein